MRFFILLLLMASGAQAKTTRIFPEKLPSTSTARPECKAWAEQLNAIIDVSKGETLASLKSGKKEEDLYTVLETYPRPTALNLSFSEKDTAEDKLIRIYSYPGCEDLAYYDAVKGTFLSKNFGVKVSKNVLDILLERIIREEDLSHSLLSLLLQNKLIEMAIQKKIFTPSDALYLEFGAIQRETEALKIEIQKRPKDFEVNEANFQSVMKEINGTKTLIHRLSWWAKRFTK